MIEFDWINAMRLATAVVAMTGLIVLLRRPAWTPVTAYWAAFAGSMFCYSLYKAAGASLGAFSIILLIGGAATCGWAWLFTRALFRRSSDFEIAPLVFVLVLYGSALLGDLGARFAGAGAPAIHVIDNLTRMLTSAVLLMPLYEAARDYGPALSKAERRMRHIFFGAFGGLVAVTGLWLRGAAEGSLAAQLEAPILSVAPLIALTLASAALVFRLHHPLPAQKAKPRRAAPAKPDAAVSALAEKVMARLRAEEYFTTPNLKVADLSMALGEPDYLISKAIASATPHPNFNRLVNQYRIEKAKDLLSDPAYADEQILTIALDCGFNSIGPFNRAFKEATGATPRAFRQNASGAEGVRAVA